MEKASRKGKVKGKWGNNLGRGTDLRTALEKLPRPEMSMAYIVECTCMPGREGMCKRVCAGVGEGGGRLF